MMTLLTIVIDLDPNIVRLGPFLITWHGVFSVLGIIAAARLGFWLLAKDGVDTRNSGDGLAWMVVAGLVGARLLYVWENFRIFSGQLLRIFALTEGGISQWGGLFGAAVGAYIWARRAKFSFWKLVDAGGAATMIGLAIGRIGDVINGEHFASDTDLPWGVVYTHANSPSVIANVTQPQHPAVAYEMIGDVVIFGILLFIFLRVNRAGVTFFAWVFLYGLLRTLVSFLRLDDIVFLGLRTAQLIGIAGMVVGIGGMIYLLRKPGEDGTARAARRRMLRAEEAPAPEEEPAT
jgi:phosphatidylglycerol---prolipoprotein diacylglyceryl transferase